MTSDPAGGDVWRVLTWNVRGHDRPNVAALAEVVEGYAPDVVALQEIRTGQASELAGRLGWRHQWALKHYAFTPLMPWLAEGHALITPHALDDTVVRTISPGVSTWTYRRRIVLAGTVRRGGAAVRIYDTHLAAHDHPDERIALRVHLLHTGAEIRIGERRVGGNEELLVGGTHRPRPTTGGTCIVRVYATPVNVQ